MLTATQFADLFPNCKDPEGWVNAMNEVFPKYEINTPERIAAFIAQCGHESGGWRTFSENLNYSAKALDAIFGKYFKRAGRDAQAYHRQPEKIANVVYAGRMSNGDTDSGDGWKYRGRGPIQLTGKANYTAFSADMDVDAVDNPDNVSQDKEMALMSAIWYWNKNSLNKYADSGDIKTMTKRINGGYIGLEDRIHHWEMALTAMGASYEHSDSTVDEDDHADAENYGVLRKGMRGEGVKAMQEALGIGADGIFGAGTERKLKEWQTANGLGADGIAGPATLGELLG
jgi:putative chitinase|tara:strand:+ start:51 stop:908 length:858 start_codon:yes stop_codon:yes gene_type:complete